MCLEIKRCLNGRENTTAVYPRVCDAQVRMDPFAIRSLVEHW